ncbi:MAG: amino acid ABC transporter permease [Clostridium sp.]
MEFNGVFEINNIRRLLEGIFVTGKIAFISVIISLILGVIFGVVMTSKSKKIRFFSNLYLEGMRIVPILVWLFIGYFGFAKWLNIHLSGTVVCIIIFSLWGIAEMGDLVRGAITSLPKIQEESALALGLTKEKMYFYVIIPQAVRQVIPSAINLATRMIKTTSLAVFIGVIEVVKVAQQIIELSILNEPNASFLIYGFVFFLYFIICYPLSILSKKLEEKWEG